jgi:hypothetical protein
LLLFSCGNKEIITNRYYENYKVGDIPDLNKFMVYTEEEKRLDSLSAVYQQTIDSFHKSSLAADEKTNNSFIDNRSRLYLESYTNNIADGNNNDPQHIGQPMPCNCGMDKDTLFVNMGIGFFGGMGFSIKIFNSHFLANYFEYTDDVKPYKLNLADSSTDEISVPAKYQYLVLDKKPNFKPGQKLTGYLTVTTKPYYVRSVENKYDTSYVTGRIYFTCIAKKSLTE